MTKPLRERGRLLGEATRTSDGAVRRPIQIITPGWGSSGYYSAEVLEQAATERVIPAGTHMYFNHASETERQDRPERDVRDIAAVLAEDAHWDGARLIAEAEIMGPHAELIESLAPYIGVSISGSASDITIGEAEGRTGPIIEGLAHVASVDFVTHAGRGGMVLLESARPSLVNARAIGHGVSEATANETREQLQQALRDLLGGEKSWVWVRDFDDDTVWFEHETPDEAGTYGLTYEVADDGAVGLSGSPVEVRATTTYVPVTRPGSTNTTTEESKEDTMPQIEEARLRELEEAAGRVQTLESERDTERQARETAERERDQLRARESALTHARTRVTTANAGLPASTVERIVATATATVPLTESGQLDTAALDTAVDNARTAEETYLAGIAEAAGIGSVTGFGGTATTEDSISESDIDNAVGSAFGRQVKEA